MDYGLKHPEHSGKFVRLKGGWGAYHRWCLANNYMKMVPDKDGNLIPKFILKPRKVEKSQNRNDKCDCGSGKKYKKCCLKIKKKESQ